MAKALSVPRALVAAGALGLVAAALPAAGSAATANVQVGDFNPRLSAVSTSFYPRRLAVAQGDSVRFSFRGFDTATFLPRGRSLPALIAPLGGLNPPGNDASGVPFWWSNVTPILGLNPQALAPTRSNIVTRSRFVSSGAPQGRNPRFVARFPQVGVFTVRSIVHPRMRATIVVRPRGAAVPGPQALGARAAANKASDLASARALARRRAPSGQVLVGPGDRNVAIFAFQPGTRTVPAGSQLTFRMNGRNENHTVSFGPGAYLNNLSRTFGGPGPALDPAAVLPSDDPALGPPAVTPTSHGNGFVSSGVMADPGMPGGLSSRFTVSFPTPGAYAYVCLIHPEMKGTVNVTP